MKEDDIELYLKAKNKFAYGNIVCWVALIAAAVAALTTFIPGFHGAVAGAECNTVIELKLEHHAA